MQKILTTSGTRSFIRQGWDYAESNIILSHENNGVSIDMSLNPHKDFIPIADEMVLNLKTSEARTRQQAYCFSHALPVKFDQIDENIKDQIWYSILDIFNDSSDQANEVLKYWVIACLEKQKINEFLIGLGQIKVAFLFL